MVQDLGSRGTIVKLFCAVQLSIKTVDAVIYIKNFIEQ